METRILGMLRSRASESLSNDLCMGSAPVQKRHSIQNPSSGSSQSAFFTVAQRNPYGYADHRSTCLCLTTPVDEPISGTRHAPFREHTCSACVAGDRWIVQFSQCRARCSPFLDPAIGQANRAAWYIYIRWENPRLPLLRTCQSPT